MSVWRRKAIECLPELRKEFEHPDMTIYSAFTEILVATRQAHIKNDISKLKKIYGFAEWCFRQKKKKLWNAAGVSFYEHLGDYNEIYQAIPTWINRDIYHDIKPLLEWRLGKNKFKELDEYYMKNRKD